MYVCNSPGAGRLLMSADLRQQKTSRADFPRLERQPITVVLDGIVRNYNIGAIFRLCDAFLVSRLILGGVPVNMHNRRLVQAAQGAQRWIPWDYVENAATAVAAEKSAGAYIIAAELTDAGKPPHELNPGNNICLVLGSEKNGVSQEILDMADVAATIPMLGMANSINVATTAAILLYQLSRFRKLG